MSSSDTSASGRLPHAFTTPGSSSFVEFLSSHAPQLLPGNRPAVGDVHAPHGTTIVALTFDGGIVMAGDRRATMGSMIASREIEKVFPADEYSAVGIAGTAGLAVELVRLFQLELEHYEKIEGSLLSLDGKANRLATMIRGNLGMAMQGLAVVPLFGGFDLDRRIGRIFSYDVTGGRYEEHDHHAVGSGSVFARGSLKKLWRPGLDADAAVKVAVEALVDAADDDSATGGPDHTRGIWPVVATVTESGYLRVERRRPRCGRAGQIEQERRGAAHASRGGAAMSMPFYVSPEQLMKDRADYARKGIARGRSVVVLQYDDGIAFATENASRALHKISEIYDRIGFAAVGKYNEFENLRVAGVRYADLRGYSYDRRGRHRPRPGQRVRADARHVVHHGVQAARGRDRRRRGRPRGRPATRSTGSPTTARSPTSTATSSWVGRRTGWAACSPSSGAPG